MTTWTHTEALERLGWVLREQVKPGWLWSGMQLVTPLAVANYCAVLAALPDPFPRDRVEVCASDEGGLDIEWGDRSITFDGDGQMFPDDVDESEGTPDESIPFDLAAAVAFIVGGTQ